MSDTYIGWDGKSYPWPPPDGWYHASDGRWWAPQTGPNPPPTGGLLTSPPPQSSPSFERTTQFPPDDHDPATSPTSGEYRPPPTYDPPPAYDPPGPGPQGGRSDTLAMPQVGNGPPATATPDPTAGYNGPGAGYAPPPTAPPDAFGPPGLGGPGPRPPAGDGQAKLLPILAGVIAVLVIGIGAAVLLTQDGDETATDDTTTSLTVDPGTSVATTPGDTSATTAPGDTTATTAPPPGTDTTATTAPGGDSSTSAPAGADLVTSFRGILIDNGLTSDELTDGEIQAFGTTFCIFAQTSDDAEEFGAFRQQAIDQATTELDGESLNLVIDAAVVVFCPEDASRLGISV